MHKEQALNQLILPYLTPNEQLIGFFKSRTDDHSFESITSVFKIRPYFVGVTDKGLHFHRLTFWEKPDTYDFSPWESISKFTFKQGFFTATLHFTFVDGQHLKLNAPVRGLKGVAILDKQTRDYLLQKQHESSYSGHQ